VNPPNAHPDLKPYPYDPKMAEKLLDEAGYPKKDGVRFEITLQAPNGRYLNDKNVALAVGQFLTDIGVKTKVELMEWASVYTPLIRKKEAGPMFFLGTISYSIYLWHLPIGYWVAHALDMKQVTIGTYLIWAVPPIIAASALSYWLVERPFMRAPAAASRSPGTDGRAFAER